MNTKLTLDQIKAIALLKHLAIKYTVLNSTVFVLNEESLEFTIEIGSLSDISVSEDYYILTNSEANERAREDITESLWAFNPSFLADVTGFDISIFKAIALNNEFEDNTEAILSLVNYNPNGNNIDDLISEAIDADGRAHFLSTYDGVENTYKVEDMEINIYRIN